MTTEEMIEVMQAWSRGSKIEWRLAAYPTAKMNTWQEIDSSHAPKWDWSEYEYRIKPVERKPREWYMQVFPNLHGPAWIEACTTAVPRCPDGFVHVREVLE